MEPWEQECEWENPFEVLHAFCDYFSNGSDFICPGQKKALPLQEGWTELIYLNVTPMEQLMALEICHATRIRLFRPPHVPEVLAGPILHYLRNENMVEKDRRNEVTYNWAAFGFSKDPLAWKRMLAWASLDMLEGRYGLSAVEYAAAFEILCVEATRRWAPGEGEEALLRQDLVDIIIELSDRDRKRKFQAARKFAGLPVPEKLYHVIVNPRDRFAHAGIEPSQFEVQNACRALYYFVNCFPRPRSILNAGQSIGLDVIKGILQGTADEEWPS